jgi:hypothetical protein
MEHKPTSQCYIDNCPVFIITTHVLTVQPRTEDTIKGAFKKMMHGQKNIKLC